MVDTNARESIRTSLGSWQRSAVASRVAEAGQLRAEFVASFSHRELAGPPAHRIRARAGNATTPFPTGWNTEPTSSAASRADQRPSI